MRWSAWMRWLRWSSALRTRSFLSNTFLAQKASVVATQTTRWLKRSLVGLQQWDWRYHYILYCWHRKILPDFLLSKVTLSFAFRKTMFCAMYKLMIILRVQDGLRITYFWIKEQIEKEKSQGVDTATYGSSKVVGTQAPVELGSLRAADGKE